MTTLEALLVTANTLAAIEDLLTESCEQDLLRAFKLVRSEVNGMADKEIESPGRYDGLAD